jgi:hypothetical protein
MTTTPPPPPPPLKLNHLQGLADSLYALHLEDDQALTDFARVLSLHLVVRNGR